MLCLAVVISLWSSGSSFTGQNTPPVFDMKREWLIPEDEIIGRRVTTVRTRDDEGDPIEFGIEPAVFLDGSGYFTINSKTGEVFLASPLTGMAGNDYYLFITANDGHQTAKIEVYIRILKPSETESRSALDTPNLAHSAPSHIGLMPHIPFHTFSRPPQGPFPPRPRAPNVSRRPPETTTFAAAKMTTEQPNGSVITQVQEKEKPQKSGPEWTSVVFPVIATVAFAPVALVLLWLVHKRCRLQEKAAAEKKLSQRTVSGFSVDLDSSTNIGVPYLERIARTANSNRYESGESTGVIPENRKWEFPRHQLRFLCLLDEGCFGQVWKCEALNITRSVEEGAAALVAVKTLKDNASEKEKSDLVNELGVMKLLDPHPNVITMLGCCTDRDPLFLILEFAVHGKLQSYLRERRAQRSQPAGEGADTPHDPLTSRDLTTFGYQVAKGMEYLTSKGIIHRDLAARNVLVCENKTCKVADFGFARDVSTSHVYERKSEGHFPIRWMAPESLYDNIYTSMTDVWSFGVLMWEIVTLGSTPYPGMSAAEVMRRVKGGHRLEKPEHCGRELYNVMFYCWEQDSQRRPSFQELVRMLDRLIVSDNEYIELDRFPDHSYYNLTSLSGEKV